MSEATKKSNRTASAAAIRPRLFVLELNAGRIHSMNTDGSDRATIVSPRLNIQQARIVSGKGSRFRSRRSGLIAGM
jgi:hypothetical protein